MKPGDCNPDAWAEFHKRMAGVRHQMLRANGLMVVNAILAGIIVGIGVYGTRYRHRAFIRVLFLGATTLFLPILSYVASNAAATNMEDQDTTVGGTEIYWSCYVGEHSYLTIYWACLVQIVGINTCAIVAADNREGRNTGLPVTIVVQAIWISYLVVVSGSHLLQPTWYLGRSQSVPQMSYHLWINLNAALALIFTKMTIRYYTFWKAQRSLALGRNPRIIVGYMVQEEERQNVRETVEYLPARLIVMGEDRLDAEKGPHGLYFKGMANQGEMPTMVNHRHLVTIDRVLRLDDVLLPPVLQFKEVCLSFALFKLLRCRFAGYTVSEAGFQEASKFFWQVLLKGSDHERVLRVIIDELSFLHQYYYTSYPVSYSNCCLPILNILTSLLTIIYCIQAGMWIGYLMLFKNIDDLGMGQVTCVVVCGLASRSDPLEVYDYWLTYGNLLFDLVPVYILLVLLVLAEARDIANYICSKWTKVALACQYVVNHDAWQQSPRILKWVGWVLRCQCKLMTHWGHIMNQCSVLVLHPRKFSVVLLMRGLLHLPDKKKSVKVPKEVKVAIIRALGRNNGHLANPATFLHRFLQQNREDGGNNIQGRI